MWTIDTLQAAAGAHIIQEASTQIADEVVDTNQPQPLPGVLPFTNYPREKHRWVDDDTSVEHSNQ